MSACPGDFLVSALSAYHIKYMVKGCISEWFLRYKDFKNWLALDMPFIPVFQISNFFAKLYINIYNIFF